MDDHADSHRQSDLTGVPCLYRNRSCKRLGRPCQNSNRRRLQSKSSPVRRERNLPPLVFRFQLRNPRFKISLSPDNKDYRSKYNGDLRSRDAAYHQGTVWSWLIEPFIDAWLKVHPGDVETARTFLEGFVAHLGEAGVGSISEVFDAEPP